eukprot:NODE_126_length_17250_cov_2.558743.p4 type:complete len:480 gc:universal NODE_126_length_17250_cov_2.558743:7919-9358(+)
MLILQIFLGQLLLNMAQRFEQLDTKIKFNASQPSFNSGVASGDPKPDRVILWTRVENYTGGVDIYISEDKYFKNFTKSKTSTSPEIDFIVKVDMVNLKPGTTYYYKFSAKGLESEVGKTKTLPLDTAELKVAVASCANYPYGYFTPYHNMVSLKVDLLIFLGDYIYEYKNGKYGDGTDKGRIPNPNRDCITLEDYRMRHLQYKKDKDVQLMHKNIPMIAVYDDHEFANNAYKNGSRDYPDLFKERKYAAMRAYFEYIPIRVFPSEIDAPIYRTFEIGNLLELIMLDTRIYRDVSDVRDPKIVGSPNRTILGTEQEAWLENLPIKKTKWTFYGNQILFSVFFSPLHKLNIPLAIDAWDAYPASRRKMINFIHHRNQASNSTPIILSGDLHVSMLNKISGITEIVTPAVASPSIERKSIATFTEKLLKLNGENLWSNLNDKGFVLLNIKYDKIDVKWIHCKVSEFPKSYDFKVGFETVLSN